MTKAIYITLAASAAVTAFAAGFQSDKGAATESKRSNLSVGANGAKKVTVDVPLAEVHLSTGRVGAVTVHAVRSYRGAVTDTAKRWLNDSVLRVDRKDGGIAVTDLPFGKKGGNISGNFNPKLELDITVPEGLDVSLDVDCGTIDGGGHYRNLVGNVDAGSVKLKGLDCDGNFNLQVDAGEINANLAAIPSRNSNIQTDAGSVRLELPSNADADVIAKTEIGRISGLPAGKAKKGGDDIQLGDARSARFGRGGVKLSLQASTGSIQVASSQHAEEPVSVALFFDGAGVAYPDPHRYDQADKKEMEKAIRDSQKEMAKAMKEVKVSHQELSKMTPEIKAQVAAAMKEAKQATAESMKMVHQQVEEAMKEAQKAMDNPDVQKEIAAAMKEAQAETDASMKEAMEEVRKAMKEVDAEVNDKELAASIKAIVKEAMNTAMAATKEALKAAKVGMKAGAKATKK